MSSTNKTTNYNLSQFIGTDKPAWLSDYNGDMSAIDAQMKLNADAASTAAGGVSTNSAAIGTLASLTTDAKTNLVAAVNEVDSHADSASTTAGSANTTANSALTKANALESALNLSTVNNVTITANVGSISYNTVKSARNSANSIGKLYGKVTVDTSGTSATSITLNLANVFGGLSDGFAVRGCSLRQLRGVDGIQLIDEVPYAINADGTVTLTTGMYADTTQIEIIFLACVVFLESFGDSPE